MTNKTFSEYPQAEMLSKRINRLVPPPRKVPLPTACASLTEIPALVCAFIFSFGMLYVWISGSLVQQIDEWRLSWSYAKAPALIEYVKNTNVSEYDVYVYEYVFRFQPGDGPPVKGKCYTSGQTWKKGDRVVVHFLPENPGVARIEGARIPINSFFIILIIFSFPTGGLCLFILHLVSGVKKLKLLRHGEITGAIKISSNLIKTGGNNVLFIKYSYEFRDRLGVLYTGVSEALPTVNIGDETSEPILYLPSNPRKSMLVDALSLKYPLEVDEKGNWHHRGSVEPVYVFLLSCFLVLIHAAVAFIIFSKR